MTARTIADMSDAARELVETDWETEDPRHAPWTIRHPSDKDGNGHAVVLHSGHGHDEFERLGMPRFCESVAADEANRSEREQAQQKEADDRAEFDAWRARRSDPVAAAAQDQEQRDREQWIAEREAQQQQS